LNVITLNPVQADRDWAFRRAYQATSRSISTNVIYYQSRSRDDSWLIITADFRYLDTMEAEVIGGCDLDGAFASSSTRPNLLNEVYPTAETKRDLLTVYRWSINPAMRP